VRITADGFKAGAELPDTLQLNQLELSGSGNLKDGYQLQGKAVLPAEQGPIDLSLQGRVDAQGAKIAAFDLTASANQRLKLSGELDWRKGFSADAKVDWLIGRLVDKSPTAIRRGKYAMRAIASMSFDESIAYTESQIAILAMTEDAKEGLKAFGEKRKPVWTGR